MTIFGINNPGIDGLDELTSVEETIIASIASLGAAGTVLTVNAGGTGVEWSAAGGGGYTNLTQFVAQTAWTVFYSNGSGDVTELALGADGTYLKSNGASSAPTFATPAGSGDVSKVGTPANDQVGVWTGDGTIEGTAGLTFASNVLGVGTGANGTVKSNGNFDLILQTGNATTGTITIQDGADGDITLRPNGSGDVKVYPTGASGRFNVYDSTDASYFSVTPAPTNNFLQLYEAGSGSEISLDSDSNYVQMYGVEQATGSEFDLYATVDISRLAMQTAAAGADSGIGITFYHNSPSPTTGDIISRIMSQGESTTGVTRTYGETTVVITDATNTAEDGKIVFATISAGTLASRLEILGSATTGILQSAGNTDLVLQTGNATTGSITIADGADGAIYVAPNGAGLTRIGSHLVPELSDTYSLGTTSLKWSDNYFTDGGEINWDAGAVILASDGAGGASLRITAAGGFAPATTNTVSLGTASLQFSDLFLAEGAVINWDSGDATITQTGNVLAVAGADLRVATADVGTNADSVPTLSSTNTFTNKRITKRTGTTTSHATPTINTDNVDEYYITAQTEAITSMTTNLSGTPTLGQTLFVSIIGTAARAVTWGASFANGPVALPTTTVTTTQLSTLLKWDGSIWRCYATGSTV